MYHQSLSGSGTIDPFYTVGDLRDFLDHLIGFQTRGDAASRTALAVLLVRTGRHGLQHCRVLHESSYYTSTSAGPASHS